MHHAKRSEASGFCYINDIVLAILELLRYVADLGGVARSNVWGGESNENCVARYKKAASLQQP
jgi:hypothetical protein